VAVQSESYDVAVVGGGAIGLACAREAAGRGLRAVVVDAGEPGAWHVAAGMLAPVSESDFGEGALLALGRESFARYAAFVASLEDPGYRAVGTLVVARDRDEAEALDRLAAFRASLGLPVERLLPSEARRREPALAPTVRLALDVETDHSIDPRKLVAALRDGVEVRRAWATGLTVSGNRVTGVVCGDGELSAGAVVVAAGVHVARLDLPEAARVPVRPVKGQVLRLRDPNGPGLVERTIRGAEGYFVPRGDGRYVLGATMEERGFDTTVTAGALYELLRDAGELVPGIHELVVEETAAGLRPATPDNAPVLGAAGEVAGLVWATGHHRNGILLAPVTAELVADVLDGAAVPPAFAAGRFARPRAGAAA
jgi:glycine oxidase